MTFLKTVFWQLTETTTTKGSHHTRKTGQFCTTSPVGILLGCCWDFVGMTIQGPKIVGMDPNCLHPKPRPTTPQDLFGTSLFLYQKENFGNTWWQLSQNSSQQNPNNDLDFRSQHRLDHKKSESESKVIHKCLRVITGDWIVKGNSRYWKSQKLFFCYLDISS